MKKYLLPWAKQSENVYTRMSTDKTVYHNVIREHGKWLNGNDEYNKLKDAIAARDKHLESLGYILLNEKTMLLI